MNVHDVNPQVPGSSPESATRGRRRARNYLTEADIRTAETLLEDGASYREVARTLGRNQSVICRHFPGRGWSDETKREAARTQQKMMRRGVWIPR